jgi:hypothetical protein
MNWWHRLNNKFIKRIPYQDRFIMRLPSSTIGCGMLHEGNIYLMDYAVRHMPPGGYVLEIGSWGGLSTNLLLHLMKKYNRQEEFLGCDPWWYSYQEGRAGEAVFIDGREDISRKEFMEYIRQSFINSVSLFNKSNFPYTFQMTSDDFFAQMDKKAILTDVFGRNIVADKAISFCYIDGNHTYDFVKRDFENVDHYLIDNGLILFDDSMDGDQFGSTHFMKEIKQNPSYTVIAKNPNYLIQKKPKR